MREALERGLARYFTEQQLEKIRKTRVFVAGCGGLGSNVAYLLVRSGFRKLTLVDFDTVDASNLNRQFFFPPQLGKPKVEAAAEIYRLLNPKVEITALQTRVTAENACALAKDADLLVEALDEAEAKAAFVSAALGLGKPVVCAAGIAGFGNTDALVTRRFGRRVYVVGDGKSDTASTPPFAPRVMVAAAKQADLVLQLTLEGEQNDV